LIEPVAFGPYRFALTDEEARVATARLALRYGLSRRFEREYVAPLAFFVLLLAFVAILAFTGLIARRSAELALLLGAIFFLASRFVAHLRLRRAQCLAKSVVDRFAAAGEKTLRIDESGVTLGDADESRRCAFHDLAEAEDSGGLLYLWRSGTDGAPILVPTRIFSDATEAARFLTFARGRLGKG
jgi:hypothetical protein